MKKMILLAVFLTCSGFFFTPAAVMAESDSVVAISSGVGSGSVGFFSKTGNVGLEFCGYAERLTPYNQPGEPIPFSKWGVDIQCSTPIDRPVSLFAGVGFYNNRFEDLFKDAFHHLCEPDEEPEEDPTRPPTVLAFSYGVNLKFDSLVVGASYHTVRGLCYRVGVSF